MLVKFTFTDSPPGSMMFHILTGAVYRIHDTEGNQIIYNEGGLEDLQPGEYCIYASSWSDQQGMIYFGEEAFTVPEEAPPKSPHIIPPQYWDISVYVYMNLIEINEEEGLPETPCPEMWPQEDGSLLWLGVLVLVLIGGG